MGIEIGALAVRRSILIQAPPGRVWLEFLSMERLRAWFEIGHRLLQYEPEIGGNVLLEIDWQDGGIKRFGGEIIVFKPERELTFESAWIPDEGEDAPSLITLRLTQALGGTVVELFHHAIEREGHNLAERLEGLEHGWTAKHLSALRRLVESHHTDGGVR